MASRPPGIPEAACLSRMYLSRGGTWNRKHFLDGHLSEDSSVVLCLVAAGGHTHTALPSTPDTTVTAKA